MIDESRPETGHDGGVRPGRPPGEGERPPAGVPARGRRLPRGPQPHDADGSAGSGGLTPQRIDGIRWRIANGAYESGAVMRVVARRILGSGDLSD